jgi:hypothetical protein
LLQTRYYAQKAAFENSSAVAADRRFSADAALLARFAPLGPRALNGTCAGLPKVTLAQGGRAYEAEVADASGGRVATITHDRYLLVRDA